MKALTFLLMISLVTLSAKSQNNAEWSICEKVIPNSWPFPADPRVPSRREPFSRKCSSLEITTTAGFFYRVRVSIIWTNGDVQPIFVKDNITGIGQSPYGHVHFSTLPNETPFGSGVKLRYEVSCKRNDVPGPWFAPRLHVWPVTETSNNVEYTKYVNVGWEDHTDGDNDDVMMRLKLVYRDDLNLPPCR